MQACHRSQNACRRYLGLTWSPQKTLRPTLEDVIIPVCSCKTTAHVHVPELEAEVLVAERVPGSRYSNNH